MQVLAQTDMSSLVAIGSVIAVVSGAIGGLVVKVIPILVKAKQDSLDADAKKDAAAERLKRDNYDHVASELRELLERAERETAKRDRIIDSLNEKVEACQADMREMTQANLGLQLKNERLLSRVVTLEARLETVTAVDLGLPTRLEAIIVTNSQGVISEWSPAATVLFHYTRREAIGKNCRIIIPEKYLARHESMFQAAVNTGKPVRRGPYRVDGQTKEKTMIPIEVVLSQWEDTGGRFFSASIRQVAEAEADDTPTGLYAASQAAAAKVAKQLTQAAGVPDAKVVVNKGTETQQEISIAPGEDVLIDISSGSGDSSVVIAKPGKEKPEVVLETPTRPDPEEPEDS